MTPEGPKPVSAALSPAGPNRSPLGPCLWAAAAVLAGLALRIFLILRGPINSDEAIVGLMAMEIGKGHNFAFYWGQSYMGSLEAYAAAAVFALLGVSPQALKIVPAAFFLAAAGLHARLAWMLFGRAAACLTLVFLFASPVIFTVWNVAPRGGYMEALFFGGAILVLAASISRAPRARDGGRHLLLGLLAGLAFWTHYLTVFYTLPAGLVLLRPALSRPGRARRIAALAAGFLAGALPVIVYNLGHGFSSLGVVGMAGGADARRSLRNLLARQLPTLLGANGFRAEGPLWPPASWLVIGLMAAALAYYPVAAWRRARSGGTTVGATALPLLVVAAALALFLGTGFGQLNTQRYLLPVYPMFALFLAVFLADLSGRWRAASAALAAAVLAANICVTWIYLANKYLPEAVRAERDRRQVIDFCRANGVRAAWGDHWISYVITFLSRQELVVGDVDRDRYEPFQEAARRADRPAIIVEGWTRLVAGTFEAMGYAFRTGRFGRYSVFAGDGFRPGIGPPGKAVPLKVLAASGDFETTSGGGLASVRPQETGLSVTLGLEGPRLVNGLILSPGPLRRDYPRAFTVESSLDGKEWLPAASAGSYVGGIYHLDRLRFDRSGKVSVYFPPREAKYIRVTLTGTGRGQRWSMAEGRASLAGSPLDTTDRR